MLYAVAAIKIGIFMQAIIVKKHYATSCVSECFSLFSEYIIFANAWENAKIIFLVNLGCTSISILTHICLHNTILFKVFYF